MLQLTLIPLILKKGNSLSNPSQFANQNLSWLFIFSIQSFALKLQITLCGSWVSLFFFWCLRKDRKEGEMEESQNFGHQHPLVLLNEEQISNKSEKASCSRCEEKVSAPCFSCLDCDFYLHEKCAEAPLEINHPFHHDHLLVLLPKAPYYGGGYICNFCNGRSKRFVYHCSCNIDLHIKCALFTYNIAGKDLKELAHIAQEDPVIATENNRKELEGLPKCFACWEPLANYTYFSPNCGFNLHKRCVSLPLKINDMGHKHPLALQFGIQGQRFCKICQRQTEDTEGFVYTCSACNFVVHIECVVPQSIDEVKSHQHAFTLFRRRAPFICDACGTEGNYVGYICCTCNIIVHQKCISLPCIIKSKWHDHHHIFHTYFLQEEDFTWDCLICHEEVNVKHGNYYCSFCKIIFHVNCVTKEKDSYFIVSSEDEDEKSIDESSDSIIVIERNDDGEATKVKHCKHSCDLMLREKTAEHDKCCEGCMLPISASFYYCSQCDFFLHKACVEFPQKKHFWHHDCQQPLVLTSDYCFRCEKCRFSSDGFSYECNECEEQTCLRCVIALTPGAKTCPGHKHPIFYYKEYEGQCSACGEDGVGMFRCKNKGCNFSLDHKCFSLPTTVRHKCDKDPLTLTYGDTNNYSECHYCDICEEGSDPNHWFYHCATCDTSAHVDCVLGNFRFIKLGSIFENEEIHPHPLIIVKKSFYYPDCRVCSEPCQDLAIECVESGCEDYIEHFEYCA